jgi:UDP-glucose 4-epimerase
MQKKKSILITGGAGYIGSHTVVELIKAGYTPVVVDNFSNSHRKVLEGWKAILGVQPQLIEADVCNEHELEAVFQQFSFDGIIHFAAYKAVGESVQDPLKYYHNNIQGLVVVCRLALKYKVMNFVFSSSCTVYGEHENPEVFFYYELSNEI